MGKYAEDYTAVCKETPRAYAAPRITQEHNTKQHTHKKHTAKSMEIASLIQKTPPFSAVFYSLGS